MHCAFKLINLASAFLVWGVGDSLASSYSFTKIVDSNSGYYLGQTIGGNPQINNSGTVVFNAHTQLPTGGFTILTGDGGSLTLIDTDSYSPSHQVIIPNWGASINDAGVVAYQRTDNYLVDNFAYSTSGVYTSAGTTIYESVATAPNDPPFLPPGGTTSINNSGQVAFVVTTVGGNRLVRGDGGPLTEIADIPGGQGQVNPINSGALNESGTVAFSAFGWPQAGFGIFSGSGGPLTTIYSGLDVYEQQPAINDAGTVTFAHGQPVVVTGNGGSLSQVSNGALFISVDPSINNLGDVAFLAVDNTNVAGIYLGGSLLPLVRNGDALDGSTIQGFVGGPSLNDHGQIAFSVYLADGREGIWVATVPEPASVTLLAVGAALALAWRSRRRRAG